MEAFSFSWETSLQATSVFRQKTTAIILILCPLQITPLNLSTAFLQQTGCDKRKVFQIASPDAKLNNANTEIDQNPAIESLQSEKLCSLRQLLPFGKTITEKLKTKKFYKGPQPHPCQNSHLLVIQTLTQVML